MLPFIRVQLNDSSGNGCADSRKPRLIGFDSAKTSNVPATFVHFGFPVLILLFSDSPMVICSGSDFALLRLFA